MVKTDILTALVAGIFVAVIGIVWPLALVWSINTLFGFKIGYTIKTWLAALVIISIFAGGYSAANS